MTNRKIKIAMRALEIILQCLTFLTLSIILSYLLLKYDASEYSRCLMVCVLVIAAYFIRKYIDNFFLFYILHALLFVAAILFGRNMSECFVYFMDVGFLAIYSGHIKISTTTLSEERVPLAGMVLMLICYGCGLYTNNEIMIQSGLLILVLFVITEICYNNLDKVNNVFIEHKESVNFPARQLFRVNMDMMITSLIIVSLGMLIFYTGPYGNLFQIIGRFFGWLLSLMQGAMDTQKETLAFEIGSAVEETVKEVEEEYFTPTNTGSFGQLFYTLLIMMTIFVTIFLIIKISIEIKKFAKKKKYGADVVEFINPKTKNKIKISRKHILNEESELDHNLKLRKIFKKKVKQGIGRNEIPLSAFPEDVTRTAITEDANEVKTYTDIYEKARYSNKKVNLEEIEKIKNIKLNKDNSKKNK